jgi:hypothetical protein
VNPVVWLVVKDGCDRDGGTFEAVFATEQEARDDVSRRKEAAPFKGIHDVDSWSICRLEAGQPPDWVG